MSTALGLAYVLFIMRRSRWGWVAGGASSLLLMGLAIQARLPMQGLLQFGYVVLAVYGWMTWSRPAAAPAIGTWPLRHHLLAVGACVLLALALAPLLRASGGSDWPFLDPLIAALGLFASWLTARVKLENWVYWIGIDSVSLYLFAVQGLYVVALLFLVYLGLAAAGLVSWRRQWQAQQRKGQAA
ncbi:MAG: nicotinamide riboside transporter PnuC [Steroidobacteraceae bacterium]